jgi:hypothetical protein
LPAAPGWLIPGSTAYAGSDAAIAPTTSAPMHVFTNFISFRPSLVACRLGKTKPWEAAITPAENR